MNAEWLIPDKLCSFEEKVRVEVGPQLIDLDCTDENLSDEVTAPHYKIGLRDAMGRLIRPEEALAKAEATGNEAEVRRVWASIFTAKEHGIETIAKGGRMTCVDWRCKHKPMVWNVYQMQETGELNKQGEPISKFIQVDQKATKEGALAVAEKLAKGM